MKYFMTGFAVCGAVMVLCAGQAHAQSGTLTATLNASDPQAELSRFIDTTPNCSRQGIPQDRLYEVQQINVSVTGTYAFADVNSAPYDDGMFGIYLGAFDPQDVHQNCILSLDDSGKMGSPLSEVTLTQGVTYNLMLTTKLTNTAPAFVGVNYTGPGMVTQIAAPTAVPTLSEWAKIIFATMLGGGAALYIQRRRQLN